MKKLVGLSLLAAGLAGCMATASTRPQGANHYQETPPPDAVQPVAEPLPAQPPPPAPEPTPPPPPPAVAKPWDRAGWIDAAQVTHDGKRKKDKLNLEKTKRGPYKRIMVEVEDGDLDIDDLVVMFSNKEKFSPNLKHQFRGDSRSRSIDLPGDLRQIVQVQVVYGATVSPNAKLHIWGLPDNDEEAKKLTAGGWKKMGERWVDGAGGTDKDVLEIKGKTKYKQLTLKVDDSDLILRNLDVTFDNGKHWSPNTRQEFKEGTRSRVLDLPGDMRNISSIELQYENTPGGGRARVQVWGK